MAEQYYDVGTWHGLPRYQCRRCPVDSLDQVVLEMHLMRDHPELFPKPATEAEPSAAIPAESSREEG